MPRKKTAVAFPTPIAPRRATRPAAATRKTPQKAKYAGIRAGPRPDLPGVLPRSRYEANLMRLFNYVRATRNARLCWQHEPLRLYFPRQRGNLSVLTDFTLWDASTTMRDQPWPFWIEAKGLLRRGGRLIRLTDLQMKQLARVDHNSYAKLSFLRRYYPVFACRTYVIGEREYEWLERRYGHEVPHWEFKSSPNPVVEASA